MKLNTDARTTIDQELLKAILDIAKERAELLVALRKAIEQEDCDQITTIAKRLCGLTEDREQQENPGRERRDISLNSCA